MNTMSLTNTSAYQPPDQPTTPDEILATAQALRYEVGDFHEQLAEAIYTEAARLADRAVTRPGQAQRFDFDRSLDRIITSRVWGFPLMIALLAGVFWLTIAGTSTLASYTEESIEQCRHVASQDVAAVLLGKEPKYKIII